MQAILHPHDPWRQPRLGSFSAGTRPRQRRSHHAGALFAENAYNAEFAGRTAFFHVDDASRCVTGDRTEFIGRNGTLGQPAAMMRSTLSGRVGGALDPCAAIQVDFELDAGEERVEREFHEFLRCGLLAAGFARFRCGECGLDRLVPFSCKGRGGAVAIVQRFGAALNLNVHVHALVLDGVFAQDENGSVTFHARRHPAMTTRQRSWPPCGTACCGYGVLGSRASWRADVVAGAAGVAAKAGLETHRGCCRAEPHSARDGRVPEMVPVAAEEGPAGAREPEGKGPQSAVHNCCPQLLRIRLTRTRQRR